MASSDPAQRRSTAGIALVIVSALCYGTVPVIAKLAFAAGLRVPVFLTWRFAAAAVIVWAIVAIARRALPSAGDVAPLAAMGAIGYAGQSAAFFASLLWLPASTAALLLYTYPAIVTLAAAAFLHERLTARTGLAVALAFAGTCLVVGRPGAALPPQGVALVLLSATIYSAYILVGSRLFAKAPALSASAIVISGTALSYVIFTLVAGDAGAPDTAAQVGWLAAAAVVGTAIPILFFLAGMPRIGPARASILSTFEPVVTVILAGVVLGESLRPSQMLGALCVLASVVVLELRRADGPARI